MNLKKNVAVLVVLFAAALLPAELPDRRIDIDCPNLPWENTGGFGRIETVGGRRVAVVEVPAGQGGGRHFFEAPVDLAPFKGKRVSMIIRCRWQGVAKPEKRWNGVKFMLNYVDGSGKQQWHHPVGLAGSRDWTEISVIVEPDAGAHSGRFAIGLEESSGKVEFDLDSMRTMINFSPDDRINLDYRISYPDRLVSDPPRRGVMSPHVMTEDDFRTLKAWNANLLRYQIMRNWGSVGTDMDLAEYDRWLAGKLDHIEQVILPMASKYGLKVVIDLHTPPGGLYDGSNMTMFFEKKYFDHFVEVWKRIASRFRGNPAVWGYDLVNEPNQTRPAPYDYWTIQRSAALAVRAVDPETPIIIESNESDRPQTFRYLSPLAMDNVVYQVHMYFPLGYTHQSVSVEEPRQAYPGMILGEMWDKEKLREVLRPVREFQQRHNARIYVGEFSAIAWAPGAEKYLADCIELFEEYGWDWSFHSFREWDGWSVEHAGENRASLRPAAETPRKRVLLQAFEKNRSK